MIPATHYQLQPFYRQPGVPLPHHASGSHPTKAMLMVSARKRSASVRVGGKCAVCNSCNRACGKAMVFARMPFCFSFRGPPLCFSAITFCTTGLPNDNSKKVMLDKGPPPRLNTDGYRPTQREFANANLGIVGLFRVRLCVQFLQTQHRVSESTASGITLLFNTQSHAVPSTYFPLGCLTQLAKSSCGGIRGHIIWYRRASRMFSWMCCTCAASTEEVFHPSFPFACSSSSLSAASSSSTAPALASTKSLKRLMSSSQHARAHTAQHCKERSCASARCREWIWWNA